MNPMQQFRFFSLLLCGALLPWGVPTEAQEIRLELKRRNSDAGAAQLRRFLEQPNMKSAPADYTAAHALKRTDPAGLFTLKVPAGARSGKSDGTSRRSSYRGPDGGLVAVNNETHWTWMRRDGIRYTSYTDGSRLMEYKGHSMLWAKPGADRLWWTFPDGSRLIAYRRGVTRVPEYTYRRLLTDGRLIQYEMPRPNYWAPLRKTVGRLRFYYTKEYNSYIEGLVRVLEDRRYFSWLKHHFGYVNDGPIPVLLLNRARFNEYHRRPTDTTTGGGKGGIGGISICCGEDYGKRGGKDEIARDYYWRLFTYRIMLHEIVLNLQARRCYAVRAGGEYPEEKHPGHWFIKGIADLGALKTNPHIRILLYRDIYEGLDRIRPIQPARIGRNSRAAYVFGVMMLEYLALTKGAKAIRAYQDNVCRGLTPDEAMARAAGMNTMTVQTRAAAWFRARKTRFQSTYPLWRMQGLPPVKAMPPGDSARLPDSFSPPADIRSIKRVPRFIDAYRMNLKKYQGKLKGAFRGSQGEYVFLWKSGQYLVRLGGVRVWHLSNGDAILKVGKHTLRNRRKGPDRWTFPDGRFVESAKPDGPARAFDKRGRPLK